MSIINNALRDLEMRPSQFASIGVASVGASVVSKPRLTMPVLVGILLVVAIVAWLLFYQQSQLSSNLILDGLSNADVVEVTAAVGAIAKPEKLPVLDFQQPDNQLIGLQFRESNDVISLEFSLRAKVVSYLKERSENGFIFHLKNIDSEIVAPVISGNRWIEQLTITPQSGGLDISLNTLAGVLVETRQQQIEGDQLWVITLKNLPEPVSIQASQPLQSEQSLDADKNIQESASQSKTEVTVTLEKTDEDNPQPAVENKLVSLEIKSRSQGGAEVQALQKARMLIRQRQYKKAEAGLLSLLDTTQDLFARESLQVVYKRSRQPLRLAALVKESMKRYPLHSAFITGHAQLLFQQASYIKVIEFLQSQPDQNAVQMALTGASHQRLDQHQAAANFYRQALRVDASQSRNWIALGLSEEHNANLAAALAAYRMAKNQGGLNSRLIEFVDQRSRILEKVTN